MSWLLVLAQSNPPLEENAFFSSPVGQVIVFLFILGFVLAGLAAGTKGALSLWRQYQEARRWGTVRWRERRRREDVMDQVLSPDGWPNGSKSLPESLKNVYTKVNQIKKEQDEILRLVNEINEREKDELA